MNNEARAQDARVFENVDFGRLTVFIQGGQPWFVAKEVADTLGYSKTSAMTRRLREKDRDNIPEFMITNEMKKALPMGAVMTPIVGQNQEIYGDSMKEMTVITEFGLYDAVFGSKKPEAQAFKWWVCDEVLPSIRKNGMYATDKTIEEMLDDPDLMIKTLLKLKEEKAGRLIAEEAARAARVEAAEKQRMLEHKEIKIQADAPKVEYYQKVLSSEGTYNVTSIASTLGITAIALNRFLKERRIQFYKGGSWHLYKEHKDKGYVKHTTIESNGNYKAQMRWTESGREAIIRYYNLYK